MKPSRVSTRRWRRRFRSRLGIVVRAAATAGLRPDEPSAAHACGAQARVSRAEVICWRAPQKVTLFGRDQPRWAGVDGCKIWLEQELVGEGADRHMDEVRRPGSGVTDCCWRVSGDRWSWLFSADYQINWDDSIRRSNEVKRFGVGDNYSVRFPKPVKSAIS